MLETTIGVLKWYHQPGETCKKHYSAKSAHEQIVESKHVNHLHHPKIVSSIVVARDRHEYKYMVIVPLRMRDDFQIFSEEVMFTQVFYKIKAIWVFVSLIKTKLLIRFEVAVPSAASTVRHSEWGSIRDTIAAMKLFYKNIRPQHFKEMRHVTP